MPWQDLEKRFKEFQVVETETGEFIGAIGFQVVGKEARVHTEAFVQPELADKIREVFWTRAQVAAQNLGVVRVWTQLTCPFWLQHGFGSASAETVTQLAGLMWTDPSPWLIIRLREESAMPTSLVEAELVRLKEASAAETSKLRTAAQRMRVIAYVVGVLLFALVIFWAFSFMKAKQKLGH